MKYLKISNPFEDWDTRFQIIPRTPDAKILTRGDEPLEMIKQLGKNGYTFCLTKKEVIPSEFSCDGATSYAAFEVLPDTPYQFYIDDVLLKDANGNDTFINIGVYPNVDTPGQTSSEFMAAMMAIGAQAIGLKGLSPGHPLDTPNPTILFIYGNAIKHFRLVGPGIISRPEVEAGYISLTGGDPANLNPTPQVIGNNADFCLGADIKPATIEITNIYPSTSVGYTVVEGNYTNSADGSIEIEITSGSKTEKQTTYAGAASGTFRKTMATMSLPAGSWSVKASTYGRDGVQAVDTKPYVAKSPATATLYAQGQFNPYWQPTLQFGYNGSNIEGKEVTILLQSVENPAAKKEIKFVMDNSYGYKGLGSELGDLSDVFSFDDQIRTTVTNIADIPTDEWFNNPHITKMDKPSVAGLNFGSTYRDDQRSTWVGIEGVEFVSNTRKATALVITSDDGQRSYTVDMTKVLSNAYYSVNLSSAQTTEVLEQVAQHSTNNLKAKLTYTFGNGYVLEVNGDLPLDITSFSFNTSENTKIEVLVEVENATTPITGSMQYRNGLDPEIPFTMVNGLNTLVFDTEYSESNGRIVFPSSLKIKNVLARVVRGTASVSTVFGLGAQTFKFEEFNAISATSPLYAYWDAAEVKDGAIVLPKRIQSYQGMFKYTPTEDIKRCGVSDMCLRPGVGSSLSGLFKNIAVNVDIRGVIGSNITDISDMFKNALIKRWDWVDGVDTSNVTNMAGFFENADYNADSTGVQLDLNTSKVTNMSRMFYMTPLCRITNANTFDMSNVEDASFMFAGWNARAVNGDTYARRDITYTNWADLARTNDWSGFNPTNKLKNVAGMFAGCPVNKMPNVALFDMSNVEDMSYFLMGVTLETGETYPDTSSWSTANVKYMRGTFLNALPLNLKLDFKHPEDFGIPQIRFAYNINVQNFNTANVEDMSWLFAQGRVYASSNNFSRGPTFNATNFNTSKVKTLRGFMQYCVGDTPTNVDNYDTANVEDIAYVFDHRWIDFNSVGKRPLSKIALNLTNWNLHKAKDTSFAFCQTTIGQIPMDTTNWGMENVETTSYMFYYTNFAGNITGAGTWNMAKNKDISKMFSYASGYPEGINLWNVMNVEKADGFLETGSSDTSTIPDLSGWCAAKLYYMPNSFIPLNNDPGDVKLPIWGSCPRNENGLNLPTPVRVANSTITYTDVAGEVSNFTDGPATVPYRQYAQRDFVKLAVNANAISSYAFTQWRSGTELTLGNAINYIGLYAFSEWTTLPAIVIPGNVLSISQGAFYGASACTSLTLQEGIRTIGQAAFYGLAIPTVTLPSTLVELHQTAFDGCDQLTEIICLAEKPPVNTSSSLSPFERTVTSIKVPAASVGLYKNDPHWSNYASFITAIA